MSYVNNNVDNGHCQQSNVDYPDSRLFAGRQDGCVSFAKVIAKAQGCQVKNYLLLIINNR